MWPIVRYFSGVFLEGWEAIAEEPWAQGKSLKPGPSEYKAKALFCSIGWREDGRIILKIKRMKIDGDGDDAIR
jgi:hypothetical protein